MSSINLSNLIMKLSQWILRRKQTKIQAKQHKIDFNKVNCKELIDYLQKPFLFPIATATSMNWSSNGKNCLTMFRPKNVSKRIDFQ